MTPLERTQGGEEGRWLEGNHPMVERERKAEFEDPCEDCELAAVATADRGGQDRLCEHHAERAASKGFVVEWDFGRMENW